MWGGSPELATAFQTVSDTQARGQQKFSPSVCRDVMRSVACRAYAPVMLEVCHLITVAEVCSRSPRHYEAFFWDSGPARSTGFRGYIDRELFGEAQAAAHVSADRVKVDIAYTDGSFAITYSRMPLLSAMVEFLVTVLGYGELDDVWQTMLSLGPTAASVSDAANRLSRLLYGYLKDHLPSVQSHRKFACLLAYLRDLGDGDFSSATIDDPAVLEFWLSHSGSDRSDGSDFRTFSSVFRAFVRLRQALDEARNFQALRDARPIGPDRGAGEVDPDSIRSLVENIEEAENPLAALEEPPVGAIKFLNKTEAADLEMLIACGKESLALPLSLMRCKVFGTAQARISQAQRRKSSAEEVRAVIETCVHDDYLGRQKRLAALSGHVERVLLASLDALATARRPEAVTLVLALRPDIDLRPLATFLIAGAKDGKVVQLDGVAIRERFIAAMADPRVVGVELASLMREASKAFRSLSRQGFGTDEAARPGADDGFASGVEPMIEIRRQLRAFSHKLGRMRLPQGDWEEQFRADAEIFRGQFLSLYGVAV